MESSRSTGVATFFIYSLLFLRIRAAASVHSEGLTREASANGEIAAAAGQFVEIDSSVEERMGEEGVCSKEDILLYQGATAPLPNGIPTYTVQILNTCDVGGCGVGDIHVRCGWFSSARLINPRVFRRLRFDDCLVNDGTAIAPGGSVSFQYANSYPYPLSVASGACG
ncbi:TPD1 protein homolog 1-like [Zingiber officinale]|uniref:TPD1 protein homolog 1-like n=1 Tax=Zingiber officinale TaxID=94328 RepID=A0A8J5LAB4_ZINOF|nr:TPD1 protein homolog 1-like [Zingiber officinale]KAG6520512.1 hypothetical protein ZIOFF_017568 [Zingiber officinale]